MIPAELAPQILTLPPTSNRNIVVITGTALRHDRFALRIQNAFPGCVVGWVQVARPAPAPTTDRSAPSSVARRLGRLVLDPRRMAGAVWRRATASLRMPEPAETQEATEQRLFADEVAAYRRHAPIRPIRMADPNSPDGLAFIRSLDPYLILTLGGAIYRKELRQYARGLAISQHDGWCPEYRGTDTVDWALYHRNLSKVANTVHILTDGMDAGPILRRSICCLADDDTPETCFARSVALGTELMCEAVGEIFATGQAVTFPQPQFAGFTYIAKQMTDDIKAAIRRDLPDLIRRDERWRRVI